MTVPIVMHTKCCAGVEYRAVSASISTVSQFISTVSQFIWLSPSFLSLISLSPLSSPSLQVRELATASRTIQNFEKHPPKNSSASASAKFGHHLRTHLCTRLSLEILPSEFHAHPHPLLKL
jgi:hypothetical protein